MTGGPRFFDAIAERYDRVYAPGREETGKSLARVLEWLAPASRVLDLGVGTGRELPYLLDAGHSPTGLDSSPAMLALCAKRARPIPLVLGDLWRPLPFVAGSFDAVLALHGTLAHPPDEEALRAFPREVARVLVPGGVLVAELPTPAWLEDASHASTGVASRGGGRGSFVDEVSRASIEVRLGTADDWRAWCEGALDVTIEEGMPGEMRIVGRSTPRRAVPMHPGS